MKQAADSSSDLSPSTTSAEFKPAGKKGWWSRLGGGSLAISLLLHGLFLAVAVTLIVAIIPPEPEKKVDFSARGGGGGSAGPSSAMKKKNQSSVARQTTSRVAALNVATGFTLPEPMASSSSGALGALGSLGAGSLGGGSGGGSGAGNGTGSGIGDGLGVGGGMSGTKGLMVFGTQLEVRSIGVVMDVSGSMTRHLPKVLEELDRVAKGSPVVLHVGCGIAKDKTRPNIEAVSSPMLRRGEETFKRFWYLFQDPFYRDDKKDSGTKVDFSRPLPLPEIYEKFSKRPNTFFNDPEGPRSTADALLAREFNNVDAIYWFADFQDAIDPEQAEKLMKTLRRKKQKLYIHASIQGTYIDSARNLIALPTGGKEIIPTADRKKSGN